MDKFKFNATGYLEKKLNSTQDVHDEHEVQKAHQTQKELEVHSVHEEQEAQEVHQVQETSAVHQVQEAQIKNIGNKVDVIENLTSTQGRKGMKMKRINMAFTDPNYVYIKKQSRRDGKSITEFINDIIDAKRLEGK